MNHSAKRNFTFCLVILLYILTNANAQEANIDSLIKCSENKLLPDTTRVRSLISIYRAIEESEKFAKGKPYLDKALALALSSGDRKTEADVKFFLGRYFIVADNHPEALKMLMESLAISESERDEDRVSKTLLYIGLVYHGEKNYSKAISYYNQSISKSSKIKYHSFTNTGSYLKALTLIEMGQLDKAYSILKEIINQPDSIRDEQRKTECLVGVGDIFLKRNEYDSALFYYGSAYYFFNKSSNISGIIRVGIKLARVNLYQSKTDEALHIAQRCITLSESIETSLNDKLAAYKVISDAYYKKNNFKDAYFFLTQYYNLRDTLFNAENTRKINKLELASKQQEVDIAKQERQQQFIIKNAFIIGFILTLLLLIVSVRSVTQKRKKNKALMQSNIEYQQTLQQLQDTQEQLIRQEKLASLGQMVAGIAHEMQNPLNFVNNFSEVSVQMIKEFDKAENEEREQLMPEIIENLNRIREHGNRASAIVRNMLMYSRNSTFEKQEVDIHSMLNDFIPLAYEGLHATDSTFNCRIEKKFSEIPLVQCVAQDISRVFLNLLTNAFYAANDKKKTSNQYHLPLVVITTSVINNSVKISIYDNGNGIPDTIIDKVFEPFFTTKPSGKGTGLGLSLSYDVVKAHGGTLNIETKVGIFTEFTITLPIS